MLRENNFLIFFLEVKALIF